ncbi:glycosyltransferase family 50 protein [Irpex rosettiformis]|uniref:Glycosyltransferase family 50 protein n=1 Tax=Irpex rosettiformis TaxID=378272 RepID=A0ACB8UHS8_9APHY|nr:glycosyltransferase family 50 protein [Irpex rosettiformis]
MSTSNLVRRLFTPSFTSVFVVSAVLRVALIIYSEWHDARSTVKYTDVDYRVFSDAARFVLHQSEENHAQGPLGAWFKLGDPYTRATYRYTPLLALLLTPNEWLHPSFGKYLFAACDLLAGVLMHQLLVGQVLPVNMSLPSPPSAESSENVEDKDRAPSSVRAQESREDRISTRATLLIASHLLNPLVFTISTRGSSESILSLFILATLRSAYDGHWDIAAIILGLSTHWKIYPFVYGISCLGVIANEEAKNANQNGRWWTGLVSWRCVRFAMISAGTFALLGAAMYAIWGYPFLYQSYLYHVHRLDHRHNFSPYFYLIYLTYPGQDFPEPLESLPWWRQLVRSPLTSFVPQMVLTLGAGVLFGRRKKDLSFAWFVQTFVFVIFNKVCTSQYFLWYTLFLPLLIPQLSLSLRRSLQLIGVWVGTQALWLSEAYKLEFLGQNVFFSLWVRSLVYVMGHAWVLAGIMESYDS